MLKNIELLNFNYLVGSIQMPADITTDDLFDFLSIKTEAENSVESLNKKIETFRNETKPKTEGEISENSEEAKEWNRKFQELFVKLGNEENQDFHPRTISKTLFTEIVKGKTIDEIMLLKKGFGL